MNTLYSTALLASLSFPALAGPDGTFLCKSPNPYDFLASVAPSYRSYELRSTVSKTELRQVSGRLLPGQGVKALFADGLMLVPLTVGGVGFLELHRQGRVLRRFPGYVQSWDLWSNGSEERFMFVMWNGADSGDAEPLRATDTFIRYVVDGKGNILAARAFIDAMDGESAAPALLFSADGKTLYEGANDQIFTTRMFSATDLGPIGTIQAPDDFPLSSLVLMSADSGFAIARDQFFRVSAGKLVRFELSQPFDARVLQMDTRSRRILVEGVNDFIVLDFSGNVLFRFADQPSVAAEQRWVSPRLAIDGSVGIFREGEPLARVLTRQSNYRESRLTPLDERDWNRVACFTPNSAALWVDDKPLLVKF